MRNTLRAAFASVVVLVALFGARPAFAAETCEISGVERVVAIGDIHGAYDRFIEILRTTGLIDDQLHWSGGKAHLVQSGDVVDRGPDSRKALDFLRKLKDEAASAGGQVHQLLGNHEAMRMLGDFRYTTPGEFEAFATENSEQVRQRFLNTVKATERTEVLKKTPLGWVEMKLAFQPDGEYAKWLHTLDTVVKIDGVVFVHGGISSSIADMSCQDINETIRKEFTSDFDKTTSDPLGSLAAREDGPLWYRGLATETDTSATEVDEILTKQKARTIVVAHTVTPTGRIVPRFDGKIFEIDTGMQPAYVAGGRASALEVRNGTFTAIYVDRQDVLVGAKQP